jgi:RNA polymerase sigma factor (sigma-70 family)
MTFLALLESIHSLREDSNLGGWLATVCRRQTWRVVAQRKREGLIEHVETLPGDSGIATAAVGKRALDHAHTPTAADTRPLSGRILWGSEADWIDRWEKLEWIQNGLMHLQGRCRELLTLLYFDPHEPSYDEIAQRLEIKVGSIGPTRARCLERLKTFMQQE